VRAFKGDTAVETMSAILKHDPPLLNATDAAIPPALASVIQHCLEKERDQRFQSARDLAFALRRLTGTSGSGTLEPIVERPVRWRRLVGAGAGVALLLAVGAAAYLGRSTTNTDPPNFQRLTFRRGHIAAARFAPDGQTVISTAAWEGKPFEVLSTRLDTTESTSLPIHGAALHSVSRTGELAVSVKNDTLARVPIGGAGLRDLLEHVVNADWAPDGSLAVILHDGAYRRAWVQYPIGRTLYEPKGALNVIRVSPDGASLALIEQEVFGGGPEWLTIIDRNGTVVSRSQRWGSSVGDGLAWTPNGREVWFTASEVGGRAAVHAMTRYGRERIVHRAMGSVRILDLARDGRALLANDTFRADMSLVDTTVTGERDLTWSDWSRPFGLTDDGRTLSFGDGGRSNANGKTYGYIRPTDGSPAVQISDTGHVGVISPDGKWVLVGSPGARRRLTPTGAGQARELEPGRVERFSGISGGTRWTPDGQRLVFVGNEAGKPPRVFIQNVAGGPPEALTPEGAFGPLVISADSTHVIVGHEKRAPSKYSVSGGAVSVVAGGLPGDEPLAWSPDGGSIWVLSFDTTPAKIFKIDLRSRRRTLWRDVPYLDPASIEPDTLRVVMSADGSKFVYGYQKHQSELYVATGLR